VRAERVVDVVATVRDRDLGQTADDVVEPEVGRARLRVAGAELDVDLADTALEARRDVGGGVLEQRVAGTQRGEAVEQVQRLAGELLVVRGVGRRGAGGEGGRVARAVRSEADGGAR